LDQEAEKFLDTNDLSFNGSDISYSNFDIDEILSSTLNENKETNELYNDEEDSFMDEGSVVYLFSIRPNTNNQYEEDWS
jgi:hypothetical protein